MKPICGRSLARKFRFHRTLLARIGLAVAVAGVLFSSPALAQQRVIVEKATGNVVDVGDSMLQYDKRYYDHLDYPGAAVPDGANFRKYMRDGSGAIVLRPKDELVSGFEDERRDDLVDRINASGVSAELKI